jgi:hypothetical protein
VPGHSDGKSREALAIQTQLRYQFKASLFAPLEVTLVVINTEAKFAHYDAIE